MAKFTVLTHNDRNLVIEADRVTHQGDEYVFQTGLGEATRKVAHVPFSGVFAVVNQEAEKADFYFADHQDDDTYSGSEYDPDTPDDSIEEFLDSQEFFNAVASIVYTVLDELRKDEPRGGEATQSISIEIPHPGVWSVDTDGYIEEVTA